MSVASAASSALPGTDGFPPFPPDQEVREEGFSANKDFKIEKPEEPNKLVEPNKSEEPGKPEEPVNPEDFPKDDKSVPPPPPLPPKDSDKIFYYRGNRTYSEEQPLKVIFLRCLEVEEENLVVMIVFNQSVNPKSVKRESFLIDDEEISEDITFSFNRKGDTIRMIIPDYDEEFELEMKDICAFNGIRIEPVEFIVKVEDSL